MTDFYNNSGKFWPDSKRDCEIGRSCGRRMDGLDVLSMPPEDSGGGFVAEAHDEELFIGDQNVELIFEEEDGLIDHHHEESSSSSSIDEYPFPTGQLFTDELELLLSNVDGDESDPEVTAAIQGQPRRTYRKSMSLPMSPVGGARERLDSMNFSEFLLSPLKMHLDVDPVAHFEDISIRNDFNLISFVGTEDSPVKEREHEKQLEEKETQKPAAASLSKGKCLELLRATHERQENLVKRVVALDSNHKRGVVTKNLFTNEVEDEEKEKFSANRNEGAAAVKAKSVAKVLKKKVNSLKADPNWTPMDEFEKKSASKVAKGEKEQKATYSGNSQAAAAVTVSCAKTSLVSGSSSGGSNLNEIKRRFLANIPMAIKSSGSLKRRTVAAIKNEMIVVPPDHNYCSPIKRCQPIAKSLNKTTKTTILIEDVVPLLAKKEKKTQQKVAEKVVQPKVPVESVKANLKPATPDLKKKKINLDDYKRLRSAQSTQAVDPVPKDYVDPISEAKEKALRMQERRKAARMKQEEVKIKPVSLVPILPLAVMTGLISEEGYKAELNGGNKATTLDDGQKELAFDEIMIVSVGCNTKCTISPNYQSTALLSNLSNQIRNKNPLTANSLLFSIQDVVIKKATPPAFATQKSPDSGDSAAVQFSPGKPEGASEGVHNDHTGYHHGEDKIIMHLRKDRIRPRVVSTECQTDAAPEFPELKRLAAVNKRNYRRRSASRSRSRSSSRSSSASGSDSYSERSRSRSSSSSSRSSDSCSASEDEYGRSAKRRRLYSNKSWSRSRSRSRSCRRSRERSRYRSRSPVRRRRSWNRDSRSRSRSRSRNESRQSGRNRNNSRWRQNNQSPEERKIVYVGRLEKEATKESLRRKFISYGTVRLVTLHEKTNGTRYGFVTFDEPADAFKAIESSKTDPVINMYDVGFGGRRAFCGASYADLDNIETEEDFYGVAPVTASATIAAEESFESLLQSFKRKVAAVCP